MDEEKDVSKPHGGDRFVHFIDWLNHRLVGVIGPPDLGPYDEVVKKVGDAVCPVCDKAMAEHTIDHSTSNAVLSCPAPHKPQALDEPVNEFGMPKQKH